MYSFFINNSVKRIMLHGVMVVLIMIAILSLIYPLICSQFNVMIAGPNEGWNAYFADAAMGKMPLYPSPDKLITNNYPPLSFYFIGFLGKLFGDNIQVGRWVAFVSLLTIAWLIFNAIITLGGRRSAGIVGSFFFLATMGVFFTFYVPMNEPQLLAEAIMLSGFVLFLKAVKKNQGYVIPIFVMVLAGFFKHNIIMLPVSALLWLLILGRRKDFQQCLSYSLFFMISGFALCYWCYGSDFFFNFFAARRFIPYQVIAALLDLQSVAFAAGISVLILWKHRQEKAVSLIMIILTIGLATALLQRLGSGINSNAQFDFNIAVAIAAGKAFHFLCPFTPLLSKQPNGYHFLSSSFFQYEKLSVKWSSILFLFLIIIPFLAAPELSSIKKIFSKTFYQEAHQKEKLMLEHIAKFRSISGDVIGELYICYRAGKPFAVDGFNLQERIKAGKVPADILTQRIKQNLLKKANCDYKNIAWPPTNPDLITLKYKFQQWENAGEDIPGI